MRRASTRALSTVGLIVIVRAVPLLIGLVLRLGLLQHGNLPPQLHQSRFPGQPHHIKTLILRCHMPFLRLLFPLIFVVCKVTTIQAQEPDATRTTNVQKAIETVFAGKPFSLRESIDADLNGDGLNDVVAIVDVSTSDGASKLRLLVLVGGANDSFMPLSVSGEFCTTDKFYELTSSPERKSFEVKMVGSADATHMDSFTLKFRYSAKLNNFELVGWENMSTNYDEDAIYRESFNYLTKMVTVSRHLSKNYIKRDTTENGTEKITDFSRRSAKYKEVKSPFEVPKNAMLQGFDCTQDMVSSPIYITEDFKIQKQ